MKKKEWLLIGAVVVGAILIAKRRRDKGQLVDEIVTDVKPVAPDDKGKLLSIAK
jgi:outer membrane murein-binding lipoprotein Lpp